MVIRTDPRLQRVLVGNPAVVTTATTAPNEVVVTATAAGSSSVVLWQENNQSRIIEVFADVDVSLLREAIARRRRRETPQQTAARLRAEFGVELTEQARQPLPRSVYDAMSGDA